jgi:F-type H+-transporting ATPase subunit b
MNLLWIVLQQAAPAAQEVPNVFNLSLGTSFWTVVIFLILLFVLGKYALPPILGYAEAREKRIQQSLDEAKAARDEAEQLLEQQRRELAAGREQAQQVVGEAKQAAERVRQDMLAQARKEQEALLERARDEIEREREQAVEAIRREAVDLSLAAASKLIRRRLGAEEDRRLVSEFLSELVAGGDGAGAA